MPDPRAPAGEAVRLMVAISRLRARIREEARESLQGHSISQVKILKRLSQEGPATAASLAAIEYVSQQAIAQSLATLKEEKLVTTAPDPTDRRKTLISVTPAGRDLVNSILACRDAWLVRAIETAIPPEERAELEKVIALVERLAAVHLGPETGIR
jgi:DNA-binding MarR family transcriptional regulator